MSNVTASRGEMRVCNLPVCKVPESGTHENPKRYKRPKSRVFVALLLGAMVWHVGGCLAPDMNPIERSISSVMDGVVAPAVQKITDELSARTAQMQGSGQLINPGYAIEGHVTAGPGVLYKFEMRAVGASANLSAAAQADAGQAGSVPPPAMRRDNDAIPPPEPAP